MEYADYKVRGIPTREKAENVLDTLHTIAKQYGMATLADLKDSCDIGADYLDSKTWWGSADLKMAEIFRDRHGWEIDLSSCPRFIDRSFGNPSHSFQSKNSQKEKTMNISDVNIMIGNKVYPAQTVNYVQTPGDYPRIELDAILSPYISHTLPTRYNKPSTKPLTIANVIFNSPATIVFWSDNTKTVVKCDLSQEEYDPEKGLAMAIAKKTFGENKYEYYNVFLHWLKKYNKQLNNHE